MRILYIKFRGLYSRSRGGLGGKCVKNYNILVSRFADKRRYISDKKRGDFIIALKIKSEKRLIKIFSFIVIKI